MCTCTYNVDNESCFSQNGCSLDGGNTERWTDITTSKVRVTDLQFFIIPTESPFGAKKPCEYDDDCDYGDCDTSIKFCQVNPNEQPKVTIVIAAESAQAREAEKEKIFLQTTISSRQYLR